MRLQYKKECAKSSFLYENKKHSRFVFFFAIAVTYIYIKKISNFCIRKNNTSIS